MEKEVEEITIMVRGLGYLKNILKRLMRRGGEYKRQKRG